MKRCNLCIEGLHLWASVNFIVMPFILTPWYIKERRQQNWQATSQLCVSRRFWLWRQYP